MRPTGLRLLVATVLLACQSSAPPSVPAPGSAPTSTAAPLAASAVGAGTSPTSGPEAAASSPETVPEGATGRPLAVAAAPHAPEACGEGAAVAPVPATGGSPGTLPPPLPPDVYALSGLGVTLKIPGPISLTQGPLDGAGYLVSGANGCEAMITAVTRGLPLSLKAEKKAIEAATVRWKRYTRDELTPNGWILEYETEGLRDRNKTAYGVNVRLNLSNGTYACARILETPAAAKCTLAACLSLTAQSN